MGDAQSILLVIYIFIGPVAWMTMFVLLFMGRRRMTRLLSPRYSLPQPAPKVTILVPAKDEEASVARCIQNILAQDYPDLRIIAINDRSTDRTGAVLDDLARQHPQKVQVIHIASDGLPSGWLGKCNALHVGAKEADGQWLLFVDSDVMLEPHAVSRAVALCESRKYDALSLLSKLQCHSFWEELMMPLVGSAWAVMYTVSLTNDDSRPTTAAANGQFILVRRSAYETVGGHESVRAEITEDMEIMRLLKGRGFRTRLMLGAHLAATRMHSSLSQILHGWGRIYAGSNRLHPSRILAAMLFIVICGFSVYAALLWGAYVAIEYRDMRWLGASLVHLLLMTMYLALMYRWSGNRARYAWLFPVGGATLLGVLAFGWRICRTGRIKWRDSHFQVPVHGRAPSFPKERVGRV